MFGQSTRKCGFPLLVQRGTSPASTALRWTLLNGKNGTAKTPLQFYRPDRFHFRPQRTRTTTCKNRKSPFVGSRLIQNILAPLPCAAATPKRFMLLPSRRFHPLPHKTSQSCTIRSRDKHIRRLSHEL